MNKFVKVKTKTVADTVSERIQRLILGGGLKPGEKLPSERNLAAEFNVSRVSLRQGIAILEELGLLVVKKGGTYVCDVISPSLVKPFEHLFSWYPKALSDMLELRQVLEGAAAGFAAKRICDSDKKILGFYYRQMEDAIESKKESAILAASNDFHMAIADCSHNLVLATVLRGILALLESAKVQGSLLKNLELFADIQKDLYQSILEGKTDATDAAVQRNFDLYSELLVKKDNTKAAEEDLVNDSISTDTVAARIEHLMICGHYTSGEKLPSISELSAETRQAEKNVEQALALMESKSLLQKQGDNYYVVHEESGPIISDPLVYLMHTDDRVTYDVLELRILLEKFSASHAAKSKDESKQKYLQFRLQQLLSEKEDYQASSNAINDYEFHLAIASMSGNLALIYLMRGLFNLVRVSIDSWLSLFNEEVGDISIIEKQHIKICDNIISGDSGNASDAMRDHLEFVVVTMRDIAARKEREIYAEQRWRYLENQFGTKKLD